jgi:hypothetical protein
MTPLKLLVVEDDTASLDLPRNTLSTAARVAVTLSPEPFSNIGLSLDTQTSAVVKECRL